MTPTLSDSEALLNCTQLDSNGSRSVHEELRQRFIGGGLVVDCPAAWLADGRYCVAGFGRFLRVFSFSLSPTGDKKMLGTRTRTMVGHEGRITSVLAVGSMRVASAAEDGTVRVWDLEDGSLLRTRDLGRKIRGLARLGGEMSGLIVLVRKGLWEVSLEGRTSPSKVMSNGGELIAGDEKGEAFVVARKRTFYVVQSGIIGLTNTSARYQRKLVVMHNEKISAVAVHPRNGMVAVGDKKGRITIYFDLLPQPGNVGVWPSRNAVRRGSKGTETFTLRQQDIEHSTIHWHSSSVLSLMFTSNGTHLMSGGSEATLVIWSMLKTNFGTRVFKPRLGGAIIGIKDSPNSDTIAVATSDNAIRFIRSSSRELLAEALGISIPLRLESTCSSSADKGFLLPPITERARRKRAAQIEYPENDEESPLSSIPSISLVPDRSTPGAVLVAGLNTSVQLFDTFSQTHLASFPVVPRNVVHVGAYIRDSYIPAPPLISLVASTSSRRAPLYRRFKLATVDVQMYRCGGGNIIGRGRRPHGILETLRVFEVDRDSGSLELHSLVRAPNGPGGVTSSMAFHPQDDILVTTSSAPEGIFKIWVPVDIHGRPITQPGDKRQWEELGAYSYRGFPCCSADWSFDGSLLAVAAGNSVTLWRVQNRGADVQLMKSFTYGNAHEQIRSVSFVGHGASEVLVGLTGSGLCVWNLLSSRILWSVRARILANRGLSVDCASRAFAVVVGIGNELPDGVPVTQQAVVMFGAGSPIPMAVWRSVAGREIVSLTFVEGLRKSSSSPKGFSGILVYVDDAMEMFGAGRDLPSSAGHDEHKVQDRETSPMNKVGELLGSDARIPTNMDDAVPPRENDLAGGEVSHRLQSVFAPQTHTVGNVSSLVANYVRSLLASSQQTRNALQENMGDSKEGENQRNDSWKGDTRWKTRRSKKNARRVANSVVDHGTKRIDDFTQFFSSLNAQRSQEFSVDSTEGLKSQNKRSTNKCESAKETEEEESTKRERKIDDMDV